ncbi:hypothetical protein HRbin36_02338 [bacterium HR36]|nr:hypothetical protein HRbin36_02338 [bacterium HR36]
MLYVYDLAESPKHRLTCEYGERMSLLAQDALGHYLAIAGSDRQIGLWHVEARQPTGWRWALGGVPVSLAVSQDGSKWAAGLENGMLCLGDMTRADQSPTCWPGHRGPVTALQFADQGRVLLSAGVDGRLLAWDTSKFRVLSRPVAHAAAVSLLVALPDSSLAFTGSKDYSGAVCDWASGRCRFLTQPTRQEWLMARFSPCGMLLATVTIPANLEIWHAPSGYRLTPPLPLPAPPRAIQWLSREECAVLCQNGELCVWRLPELPDGDANTLMAQWQQISGLQLIGDTVRPINVEHWQHLSWQRQQP